MKKLILVLTIFLLSCSSIPKVASSSIELVYLGMKFKVPNNHIVIGSMGGTDNFLAIRYGAEVGKKYIAFTNMTRSLNNNYNCELNVFLNDVFSENQGSRCNQNELKIFTQTFLVNKEFGEWRNGQHRIFYTLGKTGSFLFLINKKGKIIKIDSDFLDKEGLYNIVSGYLNTHND